MYEDADLGWFWATDAADAFTYLSPGAAKTLGWDEEFAGKAVVKIIDIDANKTVAEHLGIQYLPLIYLYKDGKIVWQTTGAPTVDKLRAVITEQL